MADLNTLLARAREWQGAPMAIATVVATWGSAPRPSGSHMLVHADGRFEGSVSGGCVEGEVLAAAAEVIAGGAARQLRFGVADATAWKVGLPCGGTIVILVQPVSEDGFAPALFSAIAQARNAGETLTIATDLASGRTGSPNSAQDGAPFLNCYRPPRRLIVVGAVQIAQSLVGIARQLGMDCVVVDPRGRFLTADRFPDTALDERWPDEAVAARRPDAATAVVTLSHDIKLDDPGLAAALRSQAGYIAALGSRRSHAARLERLAGAGFVPATLDRIDAPAGLDIGAIGPAEIALSIAAGAVAALGRADREEAGARRSLEPSIG